MRSRPPFGSCRCSSSAGGISATRMSALLFSEDRARQVHRVRSAPAGAAGVGCKWELKASDRRAHWLFSRGPCINRRMIMLHGRSTIVQRGRILGFLDEVGECATGHWTFLPLNHGLRARGSGQRRRSLLPIGGRWCRSLRQSVASLIDGGPLLGQRVDLEFVGPSFWSAYMAARASVNASIASMRFCKTWTRQVRCRTSAEITRSAIVETISFMRAETREFKRKRDRRLDVRRNPLRGTLLMVFDRHALYDCPLLVAPSGGGRGKF